MNKNIWNVLLIILVINFLLTTGGTTAQKNNGNNGPDNSRNNGPQNNEKNEPQNSRKNGPDNKEKKEHSCCGKKDSTGSPEGKKKDEKISEDHKNSKNNADCTPSLHVKCAHNCSKKKLAFIYDCWDNFKLYRNIIDQYMKGQQENNFQLQGAGDEDSGENGGGSMKGHSMAMSMPMSFQLSTHTIILFKFWETKTETSYYISLVLCFLFGVISVLLKLLRLHIEQTLPKTKDTNVMRSGILFKNNLTRSVLSFIIYSWDYLLMLIVMTFNVGLFVAVVVGLSIGFFLFGHKFVTCGRSSTDGLDVHKEFHGDPACCGC
ncbi:Copper transporter putative [Plasmodium coatneyi]|uniref:Copper transport protein n=1 Tax=Plasmodium coatneyi TaxID=208452 RepID=A0A1B1E2Y9_9APIC|nr:Copper transporter putative [Plasmodium coatneyi]ANQ09375.1 Copper transporter putative [Plasmodium coatneyi]